MFEAYKNDKIIEGINRQLIKTEDNLEIQMKEEFDDYVSSSKNLVESGYNM